MQYQVGPDESFTDAIFRSVADFENSAPVDLPSLYEVVDPDALDALFEHDVLEESGNLLLTIRYSDSTVTVHGNGTIRVTADFPSAGEIGIDLEA
jgi:hypothetical protein